MATMNVSLPDQMKAWIDVEVETGRYATASDYVRDLVRRDRDYRERLVRLDELLAEGEASGISPRSPREIIDGIIATRGDRQALNG